MHSLRPAGTLLGRCAGPRWIWLCVALALGTVGTAAAQDARSAGASGTPSSRRLDAPPSLPPGENPPPTAASRLAAAGTAEDHDGADYLVALQRSVNHVRARGVTDVDGYTLYKVLTEAGACDLGVLRFDYEPLSSRVEVRSVQVVRGDSAIAVSLDGLLDLPAPQSMIYWGPRMRVLQLPRLRVGDGVEVRFFRRGFTYALLEEAGAAAAATGGSGPADPAPGSARAAESATPPDTLSADDARFVPPMEGEYFDIVRFQSSVPILEMEYVLGLAREKRLQSQVYNGPLFASTRYTADSTYFSWRGVDLAPHPDEPRQPDDTDIVTKVVLTTVGSWEEKSRWFFDVNRDQFEVTEEMRAKVREIFAEEGLTGAPEDLRAKALLHWVAQNIRYSGQTMGRGEGYTLHPGAMIFEQRSGVCKDIAGMLVTLMRAAGMDSYAAMTMAGSRIEEVPADQFNHCVVALRKEGGRWVMYDPTWAPFNHRIWSLYEAEQHYLIGSPEGETLSRIPYSPPAESPMVMTHAAALSTDGSLAGVLRMEGRGAIDGRLRSFLAGTRRRALREACREMLSSVSDRVEVVRCDHLDPLDFDRGMWIRIEYRIPQYALPVGTGLEFPSPMMSLATRHWVPFRAASVDWGEERKSDILLYFTQRFDGRETISLPRGFVVRDPPEAESVDETYASFSGACRSARGSLTVTAEGEVRRRQIPPDGYAGFKKAMDAAKAWARTVYRVERESGR